MNKRAILLASILAVLLAGCDPAATLTLLVRPDNAEPDIGGRHASPVGSSSTQSVIELVETVLRERNFSHERTCNDAVPDDESPDRLAQACLREFADCSYKSSWGHQLQLPAGGLTTHVTMCASAAQVRIAITDDFRFRSSAFAQRLGVDLRNELKVQFPNVSIETQ